MTWVREDSGGFRCPRHAEQFDPTGAIRSLPTSCSGCDADPEPIIGEDDLGIPPAPDGCLSSEQLERALISDAAELARLRNKLASKSKKQRGKGEREPVIDTHAYNTIAKLQAERTRALRAAGELAQRREDEALVAQLKRLKRQMGGSH